MKLRTEMNYNGVVISDDLQMGAINNYYTLEQIVIQAIKSGSDILIFSQYFNPDQNLPAQVINIIKNAITSGEISEERINQSFNRIIKMKQRIKS
jgi:beta-N-acetylhexosaminidase